MIFNTVVGWQAEGMRFSLFTPSQALDHSGWWNQFSGSSPETCTSKASTGEHTYSGEFAKGILDLRILPDRIDWIYKPNIESMPLVQAVGNFKSELEIFVDSLKKWLLKNNCKFLRLAFAVTLLQPVNGRDEGYKLLNMFLPFLPLSNGKWQDLFFQFNKPVVFPFAQDKTIGLNRLINYSVAHVQMMSIHGKMVPLSNYFARIELDINTQIETEIEFESQDVNYVLEGLTDVSSALKSASEV